MISKPTFHQGAVETKLKLAEQVLGLSNQIVQLTVEAVLRGGRDIERLLKQQMEHSAKIQSLVQNIAGRVESQRERDLFQAASARWSTQHRFEQARQALAVSPNPGQNTATMAEAVLPLLIDNASWRAFIEYLRADLSGSEGDSSLTNEIAGRASELVRSSQELRSKIAERNRIEERLSQLGSIIESSIDAIVIYTLSGTVVSWNAGAELLYGYTASEVLGRAGKMLIPPDQWEPFYAKLEAIKAGEPVPLYEAVHLRHRGQRIDVSTSLSAVKDANGKIVGAAAVTRDISARQRAEEGLLKAFNANPEPIAICSLAEGRYVDVNESFLALTALSRDQVIGRTSLDLKFWKSPADRAEFIRELEKFGLVRNIEIPFLTRTRQQRTSLKLAEIIEIGGEKCIVFILRDPTERSTRNQPRNACDLALN